METSLSKMAKSRYNVVDFLSKHKKVVILFEGISPLIKLS